MYHFCLYSELPPTTLAEILAPASLMINNKFELTVDEWKFIGHPFSVQNNNFSIAFNVVFVLQVSLCVYGIASLTYVLAVPGTKYKERCRHHCLMKFVIWIVLRQDKLDSQFIIATHMDFQTF